MNADDTTPLERLEALSAEVEAVATEVAVRARAFGPDFGARGRIETAKQKLKVALDELDGYPFSAEDITDE